MSAHVHLCNPKSPENVGGVIRACSIYGAKALSWDDDRVADRRMRTATTIAKSKWRLPREQRLSEYDLDWRRDKLSSYSSLITRVAVELVDDAWPLPLLTHPSHVLYIFGPEDGSISASVLAECEHVVQIPTKQCMNLAATVNVVLYDRLAKEHSKQTWLDIIKDSGVSA